MIETSGQLTQTRLTASCHRSPAALFHAIHRFRLGHWAIKILSILPCKGSNRRTWGWSWTWTQCQSIWRSCRRRSQGPRGILRPNTNPARKLQSIAREAHAESDASRVHLRWLRLLRLKPKAVLLRRVCIRSRHGNKWQQSDKTVFDQIKLRTNSASKSEIK